MKFINAFFIGILFVLAVIFTLFVGLKTSYFDYYKVSEYFNIIFVDSVPWLWILPISFVFGYLIFYTPFRQFIRIFYAIILLVCALSWQDELGRKIGEFIFKGELTTIKPSPDSNITIKGNVIYTGRKQIYFLRNDTGKVVEIKRF